MNKLIVISLLAMACLAVGPRTDSMLSGEGLTKSYASTAEDQDRDWPERDEFRQSYQLSAGARVEVESINGSVDIESAAGSTAEVHIIRYARTKEDLNYRRILVEHSPTNLVVHGERDERRSRGRDVRHKVIMKIPREVNLAVSGVNGRVRVGQIDGPVVLSGINGSADVAQARGYLDASGINGAVTVTIAQLGPQGIHISGINGAVELRFADDLNADLDVTGINGSVYPEMPNVTVMGKFNDRENFRARIGSGGTRISVSGVNGRVRLARVGASG